MHHKIVSATKSMGFYGVYFTAPKDFGEWRRRASLLGVGEKLIHNVTEEYAWAKCVLLLVQAYNPFRGGEKIPAYYIASNEGYRMTTKLAEEISAWGFRAENAKLPARQVALQSGIGIAGKNGLLRLMDAGSYIALYTIATDACGPLECVTYNRGCGECDKCLKACPTQAISSDGLDATKCMRYHMDTAKHPDFVKEKLGTYLGCNICRHVCPFNSAVAEVTPPQEVSEAFDMRRLIVGDSEKAAELVGKNLIKNGKLTAEAIVFAARENKYTEEILSQSDSAHEAVRDAAEWAMKRRDDS